MKVKVFDTALEGRGHAIGSFTFEDLAEKLDQIKELTKKI